MTPIWKERTCAPWICVLFRGVKIKPACFAKSGGLADVAGALPKALVKDGVDSPRHHAFCTAI